LWYSRSGQNIDEESYSDLNIVEVISEPEETHSIPTAKEMLDQPVPTPPEPVAVSAPKPKLVMKVGAKYRRRCGDVVTLAKRVAYDSNYHWRTSEGFIYTDLGTYWSDLRVDRRDLIEMVEDAPAEPTRLPDVEVSGGKTTELTRASDTTAVTPEHLAMSDKPATMVSEVPVEMYSHVRIRAMRFGGVLVCSVPSCAHLQGEEVAAFTTVQEAATFIAQRLSAEGK
jgi:hypothetical protein